MEKIKNINDTHYRILLQLYKSYRINLYYEVKNHNLETIDDIKELPIVELLRICGTCHYAMYDKTIAKFGNSFENVKIELPGCDITTFILLFERYLCDALEEHFKNYNKLEENDMYDSDIYNSLDELNFTMIIIKVEIFINNVKNKIKNTYTKLMSWKK